MARGRPPLRTARKQKVDKATNDDEGSEAALHASKQAPTEEASAPMTRPIGDLEWREGQFSQCAVQPNPYAQEIVCNDISEEMPLHAHHLPQRLLKALINQGYIQWGPGQIYMEYAKQRVYGDLHRSGAISHPTLKHTPNADVITEFFEHAASLMDPAPKTKLFYELFYHRGRKLIHYKILYKRRVSEALRSLEDAQAAEDDGAADAEVAPLSTSSTSSGSGTKARGNAGRGQRAGQRRTQRHPSPIMVGDALADITPRDVEMSDLDCGDLPGCYEITDTSARRVARPIHPREAELAARLRRATTTKACNDAATCTVPSDSSQNQLHRSLRQPSCVDDETKSCVHVTDTPGINGTTFTFTMYESNPTQRVAQKPTSDATPVTPVTPQTSSSSCRLPSQEQQHEDGRRSSDGATKDAAAVRSDTNRASRDSPSRTRSPCTERLLVTKAEPSNPFYSLPAPTTSLALVSSEPVPYTPSWAARCERASDDDDDDDDGDEGAYGESDDARGRRRSCRSSRYPHERTRAQKKWLAKLTRAGVGSQRAQDRSASPTNAKEDIHLRRSSRPNSKVSERPSSRAGGRGKGTKAAHTRKSDAQSNKKGSRHQGKKGSNHGHNSSSDDDDDDDSDDAGSEDVVDDDSSSDDSTESGACGHARRVKSGDVVFLTHQRGTTLDAKEAANALVVDTKTRVFELPHPKKIALKPSWSHLINCYPLVLIRQDVSVYNADVLLKHIDAMSMSDLFLANGCFPSNCPVCSIRLRDTKRIITHLENPPSHGDEAYHYLKERLRSVLAKATVFQLCLPPIRQYLMGSQRSRKRVMDHARDRAQAAVEEGLLSASELNLLTDDIGDLYLQALLRARDAGAIDMSEDREQDYLPFVLTKSSAKQLQNGEITLPSLCTAHQSPKPAQRLTASTAQTFRPRDLAKPRSNLKRPVQSSKLVKRGRGRPRGKRGRGKKSKAALRRSAASDESSDVGDDSESSEPGTSDEHLACEGPYSHGSATKGNILAGAAGGVAKRKRGRPPKKAKLNASQGEGVPQTLNMSKPLQETVISAMRAFKPSAHYISAQQRIGKVLFDAAEVSPHPDSFLFHAYNAALHLKSALYVESDPYAPEEIVDVDALFMKRLILNLLHGLDVISCGEDKAIAADQNVRVERASSETAEQAKQDEHDGDASVNAAQDCLLALVGSIDSVQHPRSGLPSTPSSPRCSSPSSLAPGWPRKDVGSSALHYLFLDPAPRSLGLGRGRVPESPSSADSVPQRLASWAVGASSTSTKDSLFSQEILGDEDQDGGMSDETDGEGGVRHTPCEAHDGEERAGAGDQATTLPNSLRQLLSSTLAAPSRAQSQQSQQSLDHQHMPTHTTAGPKRGLSSRRSEVGDATIPFRGGGRRPSNSDQAGVLPTHHSRQQLPLHPPSMPQHVTTTGSSMSPLQPHHSHPLLTAATTAAGLYWPPVNHQTNAANGSSPQHPVGIAHMHSPAFRAAPLLATTSQPAILQSRPLPQATATVTSSRSPTTATPWTLPVQQHARFVGTRSAPQVRSNPSRAQLQGTTAPVENHYARAAENALTSASVLNVQSRLYHNNPLAASSQLGADERGENHEHGHGHGLHMGIFSSSMNSVPSPSTQSVPPPFHRGDNSSDAATSALLAQIRDTVVSADSILSPTVQQQQQQPRRNMSSSSRSSSNNPTEGRAETTQAASDTFNLTSRMQREPHQQVRDTYQPLAGPANIVAAAERLSSTGHVAHPQQARYNQLQRHISGTMQAMHSHDNQLAVVPQSLFHVEGYHRGSSLAKTTCASLDGVPTVVSTPSMASNLTFPQQSPLLSSSGLQASHGNSASSSGEVQKVGPQRKRGKMGSSSPSSSPRGSGRHRTQQRSAVLIGSENDSQVPKPARRKSAPNQATRRRATTSKRAKHAPRMTQKGPSRASVPSSSPTPARQATMTLPASVSTMPFPGAKKDSEETPLRKQVPLDAPLSPTLDIVAPSVARTAANELSRTVMAGQHTRVPPKKQSARESKSVGTPGGLQAPSLSVPPSNADTVGALPDGLPEDLPHSRVDVSSKRRFFEDHHTASEAYHHAMRQMSAERSLIESQLLEQVGKNCVQAAMIVHWVAALSALASKHGGSISHHFLSQISGSDYAPSAVAEALSNMSSIVRDAQRELHNTNQALQAARIAYAKLAVLPGADGKRGHPPLHASECDAAISSIDDSATIRKRPKVVMAQDGSDGVSSTASTQHTGKAATPSSSVPSSSQHSADEAPPSPLATVAALRHPSSSQSSTSVRTPSQKTNVMDGHAADEASHEVSQESIVGKTTVTGTFAGLTAEEREIGARDVLVDDALPSADEDKGAKLMHPFGDPALSQAATSDGNATQSATVDSKQPNTSKGDVSQSEMEINRANSPLQDGEAAAPKKSKARARAKEDTALEENARTESLRPDAPAAKGRTAAEGASDASANADLGVSHTLGRREKEPLTRPGLRVSVAEPQFASTAAERVQDALFPIIVGEKLRDNVHTRPRRRQGHSKSIDSVAMVASGAVDPLTLVTCDQVERHGRPFSVIVDSNALLVIDLHSHLSTTEVIGLLAGVWSEEDGELRVIEAIPCAALEDADQHNRAETVEMNPQSALTARERAESRGLAIVGWYHSHPTFKAEPSLRDIENQQAHQRGVRNSDGLEPFVGFIASPYDTTNGLRSEIRCFWVDKGSFSINGAELGRPRRLPLNVEPAKEFLPSTLEDILHLIRFYELFPQRVVLQETFLSTTKLQKLCYSLRPHLPSSLSSGSELKVLACITALLQLSEAVYHAVVHTRASVMG